MRSLHTHHIVNLFCLVDDSISPREKPLGGRPQVMKDSELVTALLWNMLTVKSHTLRDRYEWLKLYHRNDFPKIPTYAVFVKHCHKVLPSLLFILSCILHDEASLRLADSTMLPVCKLQRADHHKVAKDVAAFGKNHQGWHYGFKLHATVTPSGALASVFFTPANMYDAQALPHILNEHAKLVVGDTLYGASVMRKKMWEHYGTVIISPPFPKQNKKIATMWQNALLSFRSKIESVFDYLKNHLHMVTSFPRSVNGYLLQYVLVLIGYQVGLGF